MDLLLARLKCHGSSFVAFNMIGAILWVGWWVGTAYYFGKKFDSIFMQYYFLIGLVLSLITHRFSLSFLPRKISRLSEVPTIHLKVFLKRR